ncbi:MAG TPA: site-specific integrase [Solirubrobacteraceae bacterium]
MLDQELKRAKRLGGLAPVADAHETVGEFAKVWWARYVVPNLPRHTQLAYASMLDVHVIPRIGDVPLRSVNAEMLWSLRAELSAAGVGDAATRKALVVIQSMLQRAVEWRHIESNPAKLVRKPSQTRSRSVRPLSPDQVEAIRAHLLGEGRHMDATLVAVLAYAGLRPGEALGLRWHDIRERTILVERSVAFGKLKSTKTGKTRTVRLLPGVGAGLRRTQNGHLADTVGGPCRSDQVLGRAILIPVVVVEQVGEGAEREGRTVPGLLGDLDDGRALGDQQADVAVSEVVRPGA